MAIQILGNNAPDGQSVGADATEKAGFHGVAAVQGAAVTTTGSTAPSMKTRINLISAVLRSHGLIP